MNPDEDDVLRRIAASNPVLVLDDEAVSSRAAGELRERVLRTEPGTDVSIPVRRRRKAVIGGGVAGVLAAGGIAAAATGLVPDGVARRLAEVTPPGNDVVGTTMLAEHVSSNGIRDQVWVGHLRHGGQPCEYIRSVAPNGARLRDPAKEDGAVGCGIVTPGSPPGKNVSAGEAAAGRPWPSLTYDVLARTTLPTAASMDAVYPGGRTYAVSYNRRTGWAIGVVPPEVTNLDGVLVVRDSAGAILAREPLPRTSEAPADPCGSGKYRLKNCPTVEPAHSPASGDSWSH